MSLFSSNPLKKLEKAYSKKSLEAIAAQRAGKVPRFAELSAELEEIGRQLDEAREKQGDK